MDAERKQYFTTEPATLLRQLTELYNATDGMSIHHSNQTSEQMTAIKAMIDRVTELAKQVDALLAELEPPQAQAILCPGIDCGQVHETGHAAHGCEHCNE